MEYINGNRALDPEPGRHSSIEDTPVKQPLDPKGINAIADAVITAIGNKIPLSLPTSSISPKKGIIDFDTSDSLEKLAEVMVVQRGGSESNFDNLGNIKETKKDNTITNDTINLLSNIDD